MSKKESFQKFFTIQFYENGSEKIKTTKVPARKGKSLKDLVEPILENHDITFETHSVFLDASNTPLPITSDTFIYGGHTLHIRANEEINVDKRIITLMRDEDKKSPDFNKRFSALLTHYETFGFDDNDDEDGAKEDETEDFFLEKSWKDVITETENMSDRQKVQQEAIWELLQTEITYINDLKVIIQVFQKCFKNLQNEKYLTEIDQYLIFANINEVYDANVAFWKSLKRIVEKTRRSKQPIKPNQLVEPFEQFEELFQPYITFCNADTSNVKLPDNTSQKINDTMKEFLQWCDNHEQCKRLKITGFLIKPLQRVTKYSLLLKAILNKTDDEKERSLVEDLMSRVETFVSKINTAVHMRQEYEKLVSVLAKFDTYSPVEAVNDEAEKMMAEFCILDLKGRIPGLPDDEKRFILKEGAMKLIEKQGKRDVYGFLFSDVFVIAKLKRNIDRFRVIRQPFRLNKIVIRVLKDPGSFLFIYLNEYGVLSNAFMLQINPEEQAKWLAAIEKAKKDYELTRTDYSMKDDFLDDDLPNSSISKNKLLRRHASKQLKSTSSIFEKNATSTPSEWTSTRMIIAVTLFGVLNALISRLFAR